MFHHANAYEEDGGRKIVMDSIYYTSLPAIGKEARPDQKVRVGHAWAGRRVPAVCDQC